ncbi:MAG TPA: ABC transporter permease, partial [Clostridiales bacterium]|nr:ABC transporter permease [Clostridiales bacterium]
PETGMVFILGKSGSGKSTLLNVIGGLDKYDKGEIIINGKSTNQFKEKDYDAFRNTYMGFIFQEFNLIEDYSVEQNIKLALELQKKEATDDEIERILKKVELTEVSKRKINELSGGQKQRIAIARAVIKNPEIILADEPTGNLDSQTGEQIWKILKDLSKEKLVIVVSHDKESANIYADRIIEIQDGNII